jgi:4-oxalocrotonate tautomerase
VPIVTVQKSPRDLALQRRFVEVYGLRPESVQIFIHEVDDENWAKAGALAADAEAR